MAFPMRSTKHAVKKQMLLRPARAILLLSVFLFFSSPFAAAGDVKTAWDKNADFSKYRTYAWAPVAATSRPLLAIEVRADVDAELAKKGLTLNTDHPDLIVHAYGSVDSESSIPAADPTYAATGSRPTDAVTMWTNPGVGAVSSVSKGTLVIDITDASRHQSVWRAIAKGSLKEKPSELQKQVQKSVTKMFQDFPTSNPAQ